MERKVSDEESGYEADTDEVGGHRIVKDFFERIYLQLTDEMLNILLGEKDDEFHPQPSHLQSAEVKVAEEQAKLPLDQKDADFDDHYQQKYSDQEEEEEEEEEEEDEEDDVAHMYSSFTDSNSFDMCDRLFGEDGLCYCIFCYDSESDSDSDDEYFLDDDEEMF